MVVPSQTSKLSGQTRYFLFAKAPQTFRSLLLGTYTKIVKRPESYLKWHHQTRDNLSLSLSLSLSHEHKERQLQFLPKYT